MTAKVVYRTLYLCLSVGLTLLLLGAPGATQALQESTALLQATLCEQLNVSRGTVMYSLTIPVGINIRNAPESGAGHDNNIINGVFTSREVVVIQAPQFPDWWQIASMADGSPIPFPVNYSGSEEAYVYASLAPADTSNAIATCDTAALRDAVSAQLGDPDRGADPAAIVTITFAPPTEEQLQYDIPYRTYAPDYIRAEQEVLNNLSLPSLEEIQYTPLYSGSPENQLPLGMIPDLSEYNLPSHPQAEFVFSGVLRDVIPLPLGMSIGEGMTAYVAVVDMPGVRLLINMSDNPNWFVPVMQAEGTNAINLNRSEYPGNEFIPLLRSLRDKQIIFYQDDNKSWSNSTNPQTTARYNAMVQQNQALAAYLSATPEQRTNLTVPGYNAGFVTIVTPGS